MRKRAWRGLIVGLGLLAGFGTGPAPGCAAEALWKDSPGGQVPPEIARLNDFMHDLSERIKPALVQVRVRRPAEPSRPIEESPRAPDDGRRGTGSGFIIRNS